MKFITATGVIAKARRFLSAPVSIDAEAAEDPDKVAKMLRYLSNGLSSLEVRVGPESLEFEVNVGTAGAITSIAHNFGGPVRWWVTDWAKKVDVASPVLGHSLVNDMLLSTTNTLVLRSYVHGRAVVRVELSQSGLV